MLRLTDIKLPLDHSASALRQAVLAKLSIADTELLDLQVAKRSYDARKRGAILLTYALDVTLRDEAAVLARFKRDTRVGPAPDTRYRAVAHAPAKLPLRPLVIGFGPCGLFAALVLAQMGFRPIVLERGKAVRERTRDTWDLWRKRNLHPESNVQFGEGGAGTFSDGKLYSQIRDPHHRGRKVLFEFAKAGAPEEILYVAKPHIGTFRLVSMIENMRKEIEALGGEIRFGQRVDDIQIETDAGGQRQLRGVILADGSHIRADHVVLALGHSARDTFGCFISVASTSRRNLSRSVFVSSIRSRSSIRPASARKPAIRFSAPPTTNWCITAKAIMPVAAARSTVSACARAAPSWLLRRNRATSSPTA